MPDGDTFKNDAVSPVVDGVELTDVLAKLVQNEPLNAKVLLGGSNLDEGTEFMDVAEPIACDAKPAAFGEWAAAMWGDAVGAALPALYETLVQPVPKCQSQDDPTGARTSWAWRAAMRAAGDRPASRRMAPRDIGVPSGDGAILCRARALLGRAERAFWCLCRCRC